MCPGRELLKNGQGTSTGARRCRCGMTKQARSRQCTGRARGSRDAEGSRGAIERRGDVGSRSAGDHRKVPRAGCTASHRRSDDSRRGRGGCGARQRGHEASRGAEARL
jgi:hypothetical protein